MKNENERVIKDIVASVRRVARAIYLDSKEMVKRFGITGPQSLVLRALYQKGPLSSSEMSRMFFVTPANMTGIVDRLERAGLVERRKKKGDRRVFLIALTEKGEKIGAELPDPIETKLIQGLSDLEPNEIFGIYSAFEKIVDLIEAQDLGATPLDPDPRSWK